MRRRIGWASMVAGLLTVLALHSCAGGDASGSASPKAQATSRATAADAPAAVAVRLLTALADGNPQTGAVVVDVTATPSLARRLHEMWPNEVAPRPHLRQRLTVTNVALRVDGSSADVHVVGRLAVSEPGTVPIVVAVAWSCALVDEPNLGWRVTAVS